MLRPLVVLALCLCAGAGRAQAPAAELAARLAAIDQLSGRFEQTVTASATGAPEAASGRFALRRPDRFRWEITAPDQQLLVAREGVLWHYDRDLETATRRQLADDGGAAPLLLLGAGEAALADAFTVTRVGEDAYRLRPLRTDAAFEETTLRFDGALPVAMRVVDRLRQVIDIRLLDLSREPLAEALFEFTPPAGVEVYRGGGAMP